jgi:hypothetical protein
MIKQKLLTATFAAGMILTSAMTRANAMTVTGTVGAKKYLLTGSAVKTAAHALMKISFETTTPGNNLSLCAGTAADFAAGVCTVQLNGSGGPGFRFLTIIDAADLNGLQLYIIQNVGINPASFSFSIE